MNQCYLYLHERGFPLLHYLHVTLWNRATSLPSWPRIVPLPSWRDALLLRCLHFRRWCWITCRHCRRSWRVLRSFVFTCRPTWIAWPATAISVSPKSGWTSFCQRGSQPMGKSKWNTKVWKGACLTQTKTTYLFMYLMELNVKCRLKAPIFKEIDDEGSCTALYKWPLYICTYLHTCTYKGHWGLSVWKMIKHK